ncbi:MAG: LytTR family DNA-binding domain-containing protein [Bacteroidales bacterium]|nr:LytTR family DNA-binding domain-containing protein [Bacteroidales bacterium]MCF8406027.1 LytTR family DNA-binding domain-containing protein [Bacteroidales bacterium]
MKIVIIDDEDRARKSIADLIKLTNHNLQLVGEGNDVKSGIHVIKAQKPELVLLDINMPDGTGFDLLKSFEIIDFKVIFITAYEEFAIKAFEFSALDYILKPVDPAKLVDALNKAKQLVDQENINLKLNALFANLENSGSGIKKLILKTAESIYIVSTSDIIRCESDSGYTNFFLVDGKKILVSRNLKDYEDMLNGFGFFRIHQSHLINLKYIDHYSKIEGGAVIMKDNSTIPVSRRKKDAFLKLLEMI